MDKLNYTSQSSGSCLTILRPFRKDNYKSCLLFLWFWWSLLPSLLDLKVSWTNSNSTNHLLHVLLLVLVTGNLTAGVILGFSSTDRSWLGEYRCCCSSRCCPCISSCCHHFGSRWRFFTTEGIGVAQLLLFLLAVAGLFLTMLVRTAFCWFGPCC